MTDILDTIVAKSDQLNADDLVGKDKTITITKVTVEGGDQPVSIYFKGDEGKPYKPGKSMRRAIVHVWKADVSKYVGRSMTLYRDPNVKFGGLEVGGIRISHMSDISAPVSMALTATRGSKKAFTVKPLIVKKAAPDFDIDKFASDVEAYVSSAADGDELAAWWGEQRPFREQARAADKIRAGEIATMVTEKIESFKTETEN